MPRRALLVLFACCAFGLAVSTTLGAGYAGRHSSHLGFHRVPVADTLGAVAGLVRPRRTVTVVFDGLGYFEAMTMPALERMRAYGQCRRTDVGELSVSRPVFAVLSTGLEQDRTGARGSSSVPSNRLASDRSGEDRRMVQSNVCMRSARLR